MQNFYLFLILSFFAYIGFKCIDILPLRIYERYPQYFNQHKKKLLQSLLTNQHTIVKIIVFIILMLGPWILFKTNMAFQKNYFLLFFSWVLIILFFIDLFTFLLPDIFTIPLIVLGILIQFHPLYKTVGINASIIGTILVGGLFYLSSVIYFFVTRKEGIGLGDIKLFMMIGAWLGYILLPTIILITSILFIVFIAFRKIVFKDKKRYFPFGPFIILSTLSVFV